MRKSNQFLLALTIVAVVTALAAPAFAAAYVLSGRVNSMTGFQGVSGSWIYEFNTDRSVYRLDLTVKANVGKGQKLQRDLVTVGSRTGVWGGVLVCHVAQMQETISYTKAGAPEQRTVFMFAIADAEKLEAAILPDTPENWDLFLSVFSLHYTEVLELTRQIIASADDLIRGPTQKVSW